MSDISETLKKPKVVQIIVHKGEDLSYRVPGKSQSSETLTWRLIFTGGVKKFASESVDAPNGNPVWNTSVEITASSPNSTLAIVVEDGKGRPVGQVPLHLDDIPKQELDPAQTIKSVSPLRVQLRATKKNNYPQGYIFFWIGTKEFWKEHELKQSDRVSTTKALRRSLSTLGSAIFKRSGDGSSGISTFTKRNWRKKGKRTQAAQSTLGIDRHGSYVSGYSRPGRSRESSVISGSGMIGWNGSGGPEINMNGNSYNPIEDGGDESNSDIDVPSHKPKGNRFKRGMQTLARSTHNLNEKLLGKTLHTKNGGEALERKSKSTINLSAEHNSKSTLQPQTPQNGGVQMAVPTKNPFDDEASDEPDDATNPFAHKRNESAVSDAMSADLFSGPGLPGRKSVPAYFSEELPEKSPKDMQRMELENAYNMFSQENKKLNEDLEEKTKEISRLQQAQMKTEEELNRVRADFANLKNVLLSDGLVKYLEVDPSSGVQEEMYALNSQMNEEFKYSGANNLGLTTTTTTESDEHRESKSNWWG